MTDPGSRQKHEQQVSLQLDLAARDRAHLWHPYTQMQTAPAPLVIARGQGVYLYTEDGRRLLDGISSWWVNIHGHSHPRLNQALAAQARELEHVVFAGCTHRPAVELAEQLVALLPSGLTRIFYSDNGSTAVEVALKMAYQYWQNRGESRKSFITLHDAYHGDTIGTMSVSEASAFTRPFAPLLFPVARAYSPYCYRCPLGLERSTCQVDCLADLERLLREKGDSVAAVLVEPMLQAAGGMIVWPVEFLAGVRRLCDRYGTLMIADEVLTGFGRTGRMFACEHAAVSPDILCLSKALTAGYLPLAATLTTDDIYQAFYDDYVSFKLFIHSHSYSANPLACAAANATLGLLTEPGFMDRLEPKIKMIGREGECLRDLPWCGEFRQTGMIAAVELVKDRDTLEAFPIEQRVGYQIFLEGLKREVYLRPLGNVVYFIPPLVIEPDQIATMMTAAHESITAVLGK